MEKMNNICINSDNYVPTKTDLLYLNIPTKTTKIDEKVLTFNIEKDVFNIYDIGGELLNNHKKFISCLKNSYLNRNSNNNKNNKENKDNRDNLDDDDSKFELISETHVIFVVSLSCYNEFVIGDEGTKMNAMQHTLEMFERQVNSQIFKDCGFILFLNKYDIFEKKVAGGVSITCAFQDYNGIQDSDEFLKYIKQQFVNKNNNHDRNIYFHTTTALDERNIHTVFAMVARDVVPIRGCFSSPL